MPTNVDIANQALVHIGASTITSLTDSTPEAMTVNQWFETSRTSVLEEHDWAFARKEIELTDATDTPTDGWSYAYQYPTDCVAPRAVRPSLTLRANVTFDEQEIPYFIRLNDDTDGLIILTNEKDARLRYTFNQTNANMFSNNFVLALTYILAGHISYNINKKAKDRETFFQLAALHVEKAKAIDEALNVNPGTFRDVPQWLDERGFNRITYFDKSIPPAPYLYKDADN